MPLAELARRMSRRPSGWPRPTSETGGNARLWREPPARPRPHFCHELIDAAGDFPPLPGRHYPALFEALAAGAVVRPTYGRHPRLAIWGLVEARLQQADLVVLGGLNEGTWPGPPAHDPWMSRQMRAGIRDRAARAGDRHRRARLRPGARARRAVALTRAARREGVPTVPSRWLLRLDTVLRAVGLDGALGPDRHRTAAAALRDQPARRQPSRRRRRARRSAARPRQLSVTQIETWIRDPYAIYARHILDLRALDELDEDPGRAELGIACTRRWRVRRRHPRDLPPYPAEELIAIGRERFGAMLSRPGAWAFWWPRFERVARWFVAEETGAAAASIESFSERKGSLTCRNGRPGRSR